MVAPGAFICDVAVKHRPRRYVWQAVVRSLPGLQRPFLGFAPSPLKATARRCDFDRGNPIKRAHFLGNFDARHDRRLRVNYRRISLQTALVDAKRHATPTEGIDVDIGWPGHLLEEAGVTFKDGVHMSAGGERTAWLGMKDSNSEMSSQIIPLKSRVDLRGSSRILATETIRV